MDSVQLWRKAMIDEDLFYNGFYATYDSMEEAAEQVAMIANASGNAAAVYTAVFTFVNTLFAYENGNATLHRAIKAKIGEAQKV
jgi:hypothetical protein